MRILFTGAMSNMTDRNFNVGRSRLKVRTTTDGLIQALEAMGHEVDARPVIPGEDLGMYDQAIIGMSQFFSNVQQHTAGVYWALSKFKNPVLTVNDWRVKEAMSMCDFKQSENSQKLTYFNDFIRENNKLFSSVNKTEDYFSAVQKNLDTILEAKAWFDTASHLPLLFPAYPGWHPEKLDVKNPKVRWNPSEFMPQKDYTSFSLFGKEDVHIIAAASTPDWKWFKKLNPEWNSLESVKENSKFKIKAFGNWNKNSVEESALTSIMAEAKTCIVPSYKQIDGVGMWRPRHVICKNIETLVLCDASEGSFMGEGYGQHTAAEVEAMNDAQYTDLVKLQAESFKKTVESKEQVFEQLKALF